MLESKESRILQPLLNFYSYHSHISQLIDITRLKKKKLPLRVFEWFVTNYSKKKDIRYDIKRPNGKIETFVVYQSYKAQLKGHKKTYFDPFCRGPSIVLEYVYPDTQEKMQFETAIRQLNFFKWAIENLIIEYISNHYDEIYKDMDDASKNKNDKSKRKELSKSIYNSFYSDNKITEHKY